jgi:hypothetical protein
MATHTLPLVVLGGLVLAPLLLQHRGAEDGVDARLTAPRGAQRRGDQVVVAVRAHEHLRVPPRLGVVVPCRGGVHGDAQPALEDGQAAHALKQAPLLAAV